MALYGKDKFLGNVLFYFMIWEMVGSVWLQGWASLTIHFIYILLWQLHPGICLPTYQPAQCALLNKIVIHSSVGRH